MDENLRMLADLGGAVGDDGELRQTSMELALRLYPNGNANTQAVIDSAALIEAYLRGKQTPE
jgi:hypothetical protein